MPKFARHFVWLLAIASGICVGAGAVALSQPEEKLAPAPIRTPEDLSVSFRNVAEQVLPAVVSIRTETKAREIAVDDQMLPQQEEFFRQFFGNDPRFREFFENQRRRIPRREGTGSGFIVSEKGIVLTNSHVVESADRVTVRLYDGREIEAKSWDIDPRSDVAVVRLETNEDLPYLSLGDSDEMQVGDWVLALGNPFDVGTTVTAGIISATGRGPGINEREDYLQTDAAINPGNSGGPLVNLYGDVVGINTAISTRSGGYDGIGFAIPANMVRWVANQLMESGTVRRAYLGVALQELTPELRNQFGVDVGQGALVGQVFPDTPSAKAGVQPGDVILKFSGKPITNRSALQDIVERSEPGKSYKLDVLRDGQMIALDVKLEQMPEDYTEALRRARRSSPAEPQSESEISALGIEVTDLTSELAEQLGLKYERSGIVVKSVAPDSIAAEAGLQPGDLIQRVGTKPVKDVAAFRQVLKNADLAKGVLLHIRRGEGSAFVVVKQRD